MHLLLVNRRPCSDCGAAPARPHGPFCRVPAAIAEEHRELALVDVRGVVDEAELRFAIALEATNLAALQDFVRRGGTW